MGKVPPASSFGTTGVLISILAGFLNGYSRQTNITGHKEVNQRDVSKDDNNIRLRRMKSRKWLRDANTTSTETIKKRNDVVRLSSPARQTLQGIRK